MKIICGSSNKELGNQVINNLKHCYQEIRINAFNFADGETYVECIDSVDVDSVTIIQSLCNNNAFVELLFLIDILKEARVKDIILLIPYFGYARQDRKVSQFSPISIKVIAEIFAMLEIKKIITIDLHSEAGKQYFKMPLLNFLTEDLFCNHYILNHKFDDCLVVAPDIGAKEKSAKIAQKLDAGLAVIQKERPKPGLSQIINISGAVDIKGKNIIIVDDIVDSAGTLCNSVNYLKNMGANSVIAYITHGVFSKDAVSKINSSHIDHLYVTDSIVHQTIESNKITKLPLAKALSPLLINVSDS